MAHHRRQQLKPLESNLVFNSDILARSLLRIHVPRYEAYEIAHRISEKTAHQKRDFKLLEKLVVAALKKRHPELIKPYRQWEKIMKSKKPLILLIEGGTGIGTSTLAIRLGWLLEITRIVGTDSIREVIREFVSKDILPILHVSTYQAGEVIEEVKSEHDRLLYGFVAQSKEVGSGIDAIVKRSVNEKMSTIIEGIHLVPGQMKFLEKYKHKAVIVEVMIDVKKQSTHRLHFMARNLQNANRGKTKYLEHFKEIRMIRDFLVKQAEKNNVPVIENYDMHKVENEIIDLIYSIHTHKKS